MAVEEGEIHAILGANGTGKSTLAYAIMGLSGYKPSRGRILFAGEDITEKSVTERAKLGITLAWQQPASFEGLTIREYLEIARRAGRDCPKIEECLALVGLPQGATWTARSTTGFPEGSARGWSSPPFWP